MRTTNKEYQISEQSECDLTARIARIDRLSWIESSRLIWYFRKSLFPWQQSVILPVQNITLMWQSHKSCFEDRIPRFQSHATAAMNASLQADRGAIGEVENLRPSKMAGILASALYLEIPASNKRRGNAIGNLAKLGRFFNLIAWHILESQKVQRSVSMNDDRSCILGINWGCWCRLGIREGCRRGGLACGES